MSTTNTPHLFGRLDAEQKATVKASTEFFYGVEAYARQGLINNVGVLIERLQKSGQFDDDLEDLQPRPDYEAACDENDVEVVEGSKDIFHFQWSEMITVEMEGDGGMIDWRGFANAHGLDVAGHVWDTDNDEIALATADGISAADGDVLTGYVESMGPDGEDMVNFLGDLARACGKNELADQLQKQSARDMRKLFADHINKDYISSQSHSNLRAAYEDACDEYNLDTDPVEIYEHWVVDSHFGKALEEQGQVVADVMNMNIWGRTTTNQSVSLDYCVQQAFIENAEFSLDDVVRKVLPEVAATLDAQIEQERKQSREIDAPTLG